MIYRFLPRRLDIQVALICAVLMLCTIPFYVIHEAQEELEFIFKTAQSETKALAQNIAVNSIEHIVTRDYSSLETLMIRSARFPGVIDIQIADKLGKVISDVVSDDDNNTDARPRFSITAIDVPSEVALKLKVGEDNMTIWAPIESGSHIGWVKINQSLLQARQHEAERINDYLKDGAFLTLVLSVLLMLSMRRPIRMIGTAVDFATRLGGKTGEQLPVSHHSVEIEKLFEVLNKASLNLSEQDAVVNNVLKELETQKHALDEHSIVSIWDVDGIITYANEKLIELTGYSREELCGQKCLILASDCNNDETKQTFYHKLWSVISAGHTWHGEMHFRKKHGEHAWLNTTVVPFMDD